MKLGTRVGHDWSLHQPTWYQKFKGYSSFSRWPRRKPGASSYKLTRLSLHLSLRQGEPAMIDYAIISMQRLLTQRYTTQASAGRGLHSSTFQLNLIHF